MKLTKAAIAKLTAPDPSGKQRIFWADELKGFGVLVSGVTTAKSFIVQRGVNGRKRRVTLGTVAEYDLAGKSVEDARTDAANALHEMRKGNDPKAKNYADATLQTVLDDYLAARPNLVERVRALYRDSVERRFKSWLNRPLREIAPEMIEEKYRAIKLEAGRNRKRASTLFVSEPGAATANIALRALRSLWHFAHERAPKVLDPWPASRFKGQWYEIHRRERHVRADDLKIFFAAVNETDSEGKYTLGRDMRDITLLLLFTGFRRREACSIEWKYIDFAAAMLRLPAKKTKTKTPLDLPMSDLVRELLVARRDVGIGGNYVFPGRRGRGRNTEKHVEELKGAFKRLSARSSFPVNPHALRATFITVAAGCGLMRAEIKGLVNHALSKGDVTDGYIQDLDLRRPAQMVADRLKILCEIPPPVGENVKVMPKKRKKSSG